MKAGWVDDYREERRQFAIAARVMAVLWAGLWMYCSLITGYRDHMGLVETLRQSWLWWSVPLVTTLIALDRDKLGGILLILVGLTYAVSCLPRIELGEILWQIGPPVLAGIMLLASSRRPKEIAE